jgi:hypothetical protein
MKNNLFLSVILLFIVQLSFAQNGKIRGKIIDGNTGKPAISATIKISGIETNSGIMSDLDGNFTFNVKEGSYDLDVSLIGFGNTKITNIIVTQNNITVNILF